MHIFLWKYMKDATHTTADVNHTAVTFVWRQSDEMSGDVYFKLVFQLTVLKGF